nr:glycosyltransferase family 4 protein [Mesorhizobium ciceri]
MNMSDARSRNPDRSIVATPGMVKKILFFHHATALGGAPKSLALLIKSLDRKEFSPIVAMPLRPGNSGVRQLFEDAGAEVIEERDIRPFHGSTVAPCKDVKSRIHAILSFPLLVRCARKLVSDIRPDIVHLNSTCMVAAAKGAHDADPSIPVIAHVREPILHNWWGNILRNLNKKHVDYFVAIDKAGLDSIGGSATPGSVVYNSVDSNLFRTPDEGVAELRRKFGWGDGDVIFLSLSRIAESNGILPFVQAVNSLEANLPECARFVFAGFGKNEEGYGKAALEAINASRRCSAMPFIDDIAPVLTASDVVIAPFLTSHSARCIFEGASAGRPGLVTRLPNLLELIEDGRTGLSFEMSSFAGLLEAIEKLCRRDTRLDMGRSARQFAMARFHIDQNVAAIQKLYRDLSESGR